MDRMKWGTIIGLEEEVDHYYQGVFDKYPRKITAEEVRLYNLGKLIPLIVVVATLRTVGKIIKGNFNRSEK